jgi:transglutaminase-like putative cysteine protease
MERLPVGAATRGSPMRYSVRHVTRFTYDTPIAESVMEVRMQPLSDGLQRCLHFALTPAPTARVMTYQDHDGNGVHFFDIPGRHARLTLTAEALVECASAPALPDHLGPGAWDELDVLRGSGEFWEYVTPSLFTRSTPLVRDFAQELGLERDDDPLSTLRRMMRDISARFEYKPQSTRVDSPIDEALEARCGVCQDFAHVFIALARSLGIPTRYVSGYLFRDEESHDRSTDGATHAWAEALLPSLGWIGFDPTNNSIAQDRHIRVAVGRDYADVPPTRGVYKGVTAVRTELAVAVRVGPAMVPLASDVVPFTPWMSREAAPAMPLTESQQDQQQ